MKKILTNLMLITTSFMLLITITDVHANEPSAISEYNDLFYDSISFSAVLQTDLTVEVTDGLENIEPIYEYLKSVLDTEVNIEPEEYNAVGLTITVSPQLTSNLTGTLFIYSTPSTGSMFFFRRDQSSGSGSSVLNFGTNLVTGALIENQGPPLSFSEPQTYTVSLQTLKPWTQAYDYGKIRNDGDYDWDLGLLTVNNQERVYILNDIGGKTIVNHDADGAALFQSPYRNFRIVKEIPGSSDVIELDIEDVAAVYVSGGADDNVFYIYYWDNDEIAKTTYTMPNFTPPSSGLRNAYFYGGIREAISGEETMVANVDNLVPLTDFLQYIEAWDDLDGDISDQVFIEDDGNYKNDVVGVYTVTFGVTDSENNTSYLEVDIHVVDIVAPTITGTTSDIQISYTDEFSVSSWVNSLQVTDNYYTSNLDITVKTNTYSANKTTPGNYYVEVKVTDGSGNVGTLIRNITVVDDKGPEFQGLQTITTSISENLTINDIKSGLAAIDAIDGNVTNSITVDSDQLTGNNTQPGTYEVIFKAVDSQGNASFHTVTVTIVSQPPKFYIIDGSSIRLLPGANLTIEQILALLGVTDPINLTSNYNAEVPGTYQLSFTVGNEDYNLNIIVLGANQPGIPPALVGDNNFKIDWKIVGWVVLGLVAVVGVAYILKKKK